MAIYRKKYTKPIPDNAIIVTQNGRRLAEWKTKHGKRKSAEVTPDGTRIRLESSTWFIRFRDGEDQLQDISTGCKDKQSAASMLADQLALADKVRAKIVTNDELKISEQGKRLLDSHIAEFIEYQQAKKTHASRVKAYETRLTESARGCGWLFLSDLPPMNWIVGLRHRPKMNARWDRASTTGSWKLGPHSGIGVSAKGQKVSDNSKATCVV